jgi:exodeoxyribonuclease III
VKIATWNVNSIRARLPRVMEWLEGARPDVLLLQETKVETEAFPGAPFEDQGYNLATVGEAGGRNGVAILSKRPIEDVVESLPGDPGDLEARYIEAFTCGLRVASVYVPNGTSIGSERFAFKLAFFERLRAHAAELLEPDEPFVIGGDFNVAPAVIDVFDPEALEGTVCYHKDERARFRALINLGLYDAFRVVEPARTQVYSWWDYKGRAVKANQGLRIDHLLLSPEATDRLAACAIDGDVRVLKAPSDHAPVWCELAEPEALAA